MIEDLITRGVDGIAISAIDPNNQAQLLNSAAEKTFLITHDSDAPNINRMCYVGMDNYLAGWMCGELVREAMPEGGELAIFIGRLEQDNAKLRRQGMIDAVLQRSQDPSRYDAPGGGPLEGGGFTIVDTRTDQFDRAKAKANAEDLLIKYPNLAGMVGLFAYNTPLCLDAVKAAGKLDQVVVIAFDEPDEVLQAITAGEIHGTVVQNPYEYGFQSVKVLAALTRGDESLIPENKFINIEARRIVKDNVTEFWDDLKAKVAAGSN
jgi:ribose transport system substrate-binding protein